MRNIMRRMMMMGAIFLIAFAMTACTNENDIGEEQSFTWWIPKDDSAGTYYEGYEENPIIQWLNNQKWSTETGTHTNDGTGTQLALDFMLPVQGNESDNFNTMIATGSYPEIIHLAYSTDSPKQLVNEGVSIEITQYVEEYMPDYLAFIEEHPEIKPFVMDVDEEGNEHYYALYNVSNAPIRPWHGYMYRRDWVVNYATPSTHIWDWESTYVTGHGHPAYTPLSEAKAQNDLTGWKENTVTEFTSNFGDDETWEDNIVFPSGTEDPLYISDWEWMFQAFTDALEAEGYSDDSNAYPISLFYMGYLETGDLVSSFGGGGPMWFLNDSGEPAFGATNDNFRTYINAMHTWYENGWLDERFASRGSDMFFKINQTGVAQGKVGMFDGGIGMLGTTIRATAENEQAQEQAMVFGSSLPINDIYGDEENKYKEPDMFYHQGIIGPPISFTEKCEGKDLETLFTMLNWLYTEEGGILTSIGLNEEQYQSMEFDPDLYAEHGLTSMYDIIERDDEEDDLFQFNVPADDPLKRALSSERISANMQIWQLDGYEMDFGYSKVVEEAFLQWIRYEDTASIMDYEELFTDEQSKTGTRVHTYINDAMSQKVPEMIQNGTGDWQTYVDRLEKYGPQRRTAIYVDILQEIEDKY